MCDKVHVCATHRDGAWVEYIALCGCDNFHCSVYLNIAKHRPPTCEVCIMLAFSGLPGCGDKHHKYTP